MEQSEKRVLVLLDDTVNSKIVIDYLINMSLCHEEWRVNLVHVFRSPSASEELMGKKFISQQPGRMLEMLQEAKGRLVKNGFSQDSVDIEILKMDYPTVADGIIEQYKKQNYNMVVIGRKKMSKAEEFVMGDISIKLIRMLEGTAVLVVKS